MANNWNIPDWLEKDVRERDKACVYCGCRAHGKNAQAMIGYLVRPLSEEPGSGGEKNRNNHIGNIVKPWLRPGFLAVIRWRCCGGWLSLAPPKFFNKPAKCPWFRRGQPGDGKGCPCGKIYKSIHSYGFENDLSGFC